MSITTEDGSRWAGKFSLSPNCETWGEITFNRDKTSLYLHDRNKFDPHAAASETLFGTLHDLTKVSLIDCIVTEGLGTGSVDDERYHFARLFPHFVLHGARHIDGSAEEIESIEFGVDDQYRIFYDFDAFSSSLDPSAFIDEIVRANAAAVGRDIATGSQPAILYFTGRSEILIADTVYGDVSVRHNPYLNFFGVPAFIGIKNRILVSLRFRQPLAVRAALDSIHPFLGFLEIVAGRRQNLTELRVFTKTDPQRPLDVYWSMPPRRDSSSDGEAPQSGDMLFAAHEDMSHFAEVLTNWLRAYQHRADARLRFSNSFANRAHYTIDRMIGSANMFDILPPDAVPPDVPVPEDLAAAKAQAKVLFEGLPQSPERDSVLSTLGRLGKASLRRKIEHRAHIVVAATGDKFAEIDLVIREAVICRNHYVHGSKASFDYASNFSKVNFFTDTLEFIFAVSELVEAGWQIGPWRERGTSMSHPFAAYLVEYARRLQRLKLLIADTANNVQQPQFS